MIKVGRHNDTSPHRHALTLVSNQPEVPAMVRKAINGQAQLGDEAICRDLPQLLLHLQRQPESMVLVDLDPEPARILVNLEAIITRFPQSRFVLLTESEQDGLLLDAMNIGAHFCLPKQAIDSRLGQVLQRLGGENGRGRKVLGQTFTVLSAGGGCGSTTVAVNLAHEIQISTKESTLVVDADWHYGAVASYLDLQSRFGLTDILGTTGEIDADLIRSTTESTGSGLDALLNLASTDGSQPLSVDAERVSTALATCQMAYPYTVVDAPRQPIPIMLNLAAMSRLILIVFQLTVKDVRMTRTLVSCLQEHHVPTDNILLLANRYRRRRHWITLAEASKSLQELPIHTVRNDYAAAAKAANWGKPLQQVAQRSGIRADLHRVTDRILEARL